jgi:O-6-methylguanine DNA methyltransferase
VQNLGEVWFGVAVEEAQIIASTFGILEKQVEQNLKQNLPSNSSFSKAADSSDFAKKTLLNLKDIYYGKDTKEKVCLDLSRLSAYTQRVLKTVRQIPVGYVSSYGGVSRAAGGGARAVGNVMASNPLALFIPCHRVVTSKMGLGGYGGGLKTKYELLKREKRGHHECKNIFADGGGVLKIFPVEKVLEKLQSKNLEASSK